MVSFRSRSNPAVVILGLGRFGMALGEELVHSGVEVMGIDTNPAVVDKASAILTYAAVSDTTSEEALRQLAVNEASRVVIGIGADMGASLLTASAVVEFNIPSIWAKALNNSHAKILKQIGVHHIIRPEQDTGRRIAHLMNGRVQEYAEFDRDYAIVKIAPPVSVLGKKVSDFDRVQIIAVRPAGGMFRQSKPEMVLRSGDLILAAGNPDELERFGTLD
ncbi:potassium channel family protein [Corynebacterium rouxii]|uniref:TrkA family potassium uptake protein n=1 Tax=Corynebacterium rouxii TaxID=2719119 RepID=A0ABU3PPH2_9CORY|nr:TrkA family potassium uptake protein [Corynebacterium rouxii]MDT9409483.1 TrkA family potassium uptake protein [Corynebacterium rouxii]MDT9411716.1 TrkA family potassium uptake protein [Corynebacterium rouxii]